jgi:hypothetical protein
MSINKDYSSMRFSELIIELTETWIMWMKNNKTSHDVSISFELRRKSAEECEELIRREYLIVEQLDDFFEKNGQKGVTGRDKKVDESVGEGEK